MIAEAEKSPPPRPKHVSAAAAAVLADPPPMRRRQKTHPRLRTQHPYETKAAGSGTGAVLAISVMSDKKLGDLSKRNDICSSFIEADQSTLWRRRTRTQKSSQRKERKTIDTATQTPIHPRTSAFSLGVFLCRKKSMSDKQSLSRRKENVREKRQQKKMSES